MFPRAKNIETSFRLIRAICMVSILGSFGLGGYLFFAAGQAERRMEGRIYILSNGKVMEALAGDRNENIPAEARDHIREFHRLFFTLDPDEKLIDADLTEALYLADGSAEREYRNLREKGYYAEVVAANISQRLEIDSVELNVGSEPFYFRLYGVETITRATSIVTRDLVTEGYLRKVIRTDNNPHGFLIERWAILSNRDLKVEGR